MSNYPNLFRDPVGDTYLEDALWSGDPHSTAKLLAERLINIHNPKESDSEIKLKEFKNQFRAIVEYVRLSNLSKEKGTELHRADPIRQFCDTLSGELAKDHNIPFWCVREVRQAGWSELKSDSAFIKGAQVVRVNTVPFFEAVYLKKMADSLKEDSRYVIRLVDVAWGEVGSALQSGLIDAAVYNDTIISRQNFPRHNAYWMDLYRYRKYFLIERSGGESLLNNQITASQFCDIISIRNEITIFIVASSDFEVLLNELLSNGCGIDPLKYEGAPDASQNAPYKVATLEKLCSKKSRVRAYYDSDKCIEEYITQGKEGDICIASGMHAYYIKDQFYTRFRVAGFLQRENQGSASEDEPSPLHDRTTNCRLWFRRDRSDDNLIDFLADTWNNQVVNKTSWADSADLAFLNAQDRAAFVRQEDMTDLHDLDQIFKARRLKVGG